MIEDRHKKTWADFAFVILALLLFAYTLSRAYILSFTFDESYSYTSYVKDSYWHIFRYYFLTSNNHALNSLCMKLSTEFIPASDFSLRWHSLAGHAVFLVCSWLFLKDIRNPFFRIGAFLLVNTNPFVLDFFSLARGYGLAQGMMMASLYFLKMYMEVPQNNLKWLAGSAVAAGLAAMANFTWLNYILAMLGVAALWACYVQFRNGRRNYLWQSLLVLAISAAPFLYYVLKVSFKLKAEKELYYGGRKGLWIDTVSTLIDSTLYLSHYVLNGRLFMQASIIVLLAAGLLFMVYIFLIKKADPGRYRVFLAISAIFVAVVVGTKLQHMFMNTYYLVDRTAMLFIPLFTMASCYLLYHIYEIYKATVVVFVLFVGLAMFNFAHVMNFTKTETWPEQADVKNMMRDLGRVHAQMGNDKKGIFLSPFWTCGPAADFYRDVFNFTWLKKVEVRPPTLKENYFYFADSEVSVLQSKPLKLIKRYPGTKSVLLQNLDPMQQEVFAKGNMNLEPGEPGTEGAEFSTSHDKTGTHSVFLKPGDFSPGLSFPVGKMIGDSFYRVEASVWIYFDNPAKRGGELVISVSDSQKIYKWTSQNLERYFDMEGHWMHVKFGDWMPMVRTAKDMVQVRMYNNSKDVVFYMDALEAKVIK